MLGSESLLEVSLDRLGYLHIWTTPLVKLMAGHTIWGEERLVCSKEPRMDGRL
jgi:hypothetical protein